LISVVQLGTIDYTTGLRLQQQLVELRKQEKISDVLLLLEHTPVITLGRNAKASNVVASSELLEQRGVELFESDRGGDVTFHGPGQIVGYPIFDLRGFAYFAALSSRAEVNDSAANRSVKSKDLVSPVRKHLGVVEFVRRLEEVLIRTCADFTIPTKRISGLTGVWTDPNSQCGNDLHAHPKSLSFPASARNLLSADAATDVAHEAKIAAIGVHISRFVTSHGFALNVNTDLSYFNLIVPCGISKPVTSMQRGLGRELALNDVGESISRNFGVVFQSQILGLESLDALLCGAVRSAALP
jgi:lipoyl(octanoyl) transferase